MNPSDWSERYNASNTRWDLGRSPQTLLDFMATQPPGQNILIPGCGRGYEIADLTALGHRVQALDYSPGAIRAARETIGPLADSILQADFFACDLPLGSFDLCYERTFLCALPADLRARYAERIASLLKPAGLLIGVFLYGTPEEDGPPRPLKAEERKTILESHFSLTTDVPCSSDLPVFRQWEERWQVWKKSGLL
jgi:SAM-dependent methyltransferase